MTAGQILTVNAGSSSIRFAVFAAATDRAPSRLLRGSIERVGRGARVTASDARGATLFEEALAEYGDGSAALCRALERLPVGALVGVGHRIVHGGQRFSEPVAVSGDVRAELRRLIPLDPLHQPRSLALIDAIGALYPALPQVACFDTAFHRDQPPVARAFALPRELTESGIRRYGFHGLSFEYIATVLPEHIGPLADGRVIVAHLGAGASMCALRNRKSVATTMGFSAIDGLMMATRCGALDPGVLLYLLDQGWDGPRLTRLLWSESGLLGVSGVSGDVRDLLASSDVLARDALDLFVYRITRDIGSLAAAIGGLDALVFCGGIGEHAAEIRARICAGAAWLGLALDAAANAATVGRISADDSAVSVNIIPTDEESMIARHTLRTLHSR